MRLATTDDLPAMTDFIYERFSKLEYFTFLTEGMEDQEAFLKKLIIAELPLLIKYGEIRLYGEPLAGLISGIPSKDFTLMRQIICSFPIRKIIRTIPKKEQKQFMRKNKQIGEIHYSLPWHKKYSKNSYYISQIAVAKEAKGTGLLREMLTPIMADCQKKNMDIVLETMSEANVPIYQHFGFELVEFHHSSSVPFDEYCFIKRAT